MSTTHPSHEEAEARYLWWAQNLADPTMERRSRAKGRPTSLLSAVIKITLPPLRSRSARVNPRILLTTAEGTGGSTTLRVVSASGGVVDLSSIGVVRETAGPGESHEGNVEEV